MALAVITLSIQDSDGDTAPFSIYFNPGDGDDVVSLSEDYAEVLWNVVRPLINGVLVGVEITLKPDFSGWTNNTPATISDIEEKALFHIRVCGGFRPLRLTLPTVKETIFDNAGAGKLVDTTNSDYIEFAHTLENGVVDDGVAMTDSHGVDVCEVFYGEQYFGKG